MRDILYNLLLLLVYTYARCAQPDYTARIVTSFT